MWTESTKDCVVFVLFNICWLKQLDLENSYSCNICEYFQHWMFSSVGTIHHSIFHTCYFLTSESWGAAAANPCCTQRQRAIYSLAHTCGQHRVPDSPHVHFFRLWEEAREPWERIWENMQAPHRKVPGWESNPQPSCCEVAALCCGHWYQDTGRGERSVWAAWLETVEKQQSLSKPLVVTRACSKTSLSAQQGQHFTVKHFQIHTFGTVLFCDSIFKQRCEVEAHACLCFNNYEPRKNPIFTNANKGLYELKA